MKPRLAVAAVPILLLAGCSGAPQDVNMAACDAFAHYLRAADGDPEAMDRRTTVNQVGYEISTADAQADQRITDAFAVLRRTQDGNVASWVLGADTFATACIDLGWEA